MTEQIDQIIALVAGGCIYLQSIYNDISVEGDTVAGNSYYVGYRCAGAEDSTPLEGEQPGQVYQSSSIASVSNAPTDITT